MEHIWFVKVGYTQKPHSTLLMKHLSSALCLSDYKQTCILFQLGPTGIYKAVLDPRLRVIPCRFPKWTAHLTLLIGTWTPSNLFNSFDETQPTRKNISCKEKKNLHKPLNECNSITIFTSSNKIFKSKLRLLLNIKWSLFHGSEKTPAQCCTL